MFIGRAPSISGTLCIDKQLNFCLYSEQQLLPSSSYKHILANDAESLLSQVINLMACLKNLKTSNSSTSILLAKIMQLIEEFSDLVENAHESRHRLCNFILEQLNLITQNKRQRRYSADLLLTSYFTNATSSKAYERLREEQVLILPSAKTLKKITLNLDRRTGLDDAGYLKMRFSKLNAFDRNVLLMIDEVYLSKRVEASGGQVFGVTDSCDVAATALCFMVKFLSSGYKDKNFDYFRAIRAGTEVYRS